MGGFLSLANQSEQIVGLYPAAYAAGLLGPAQPPLLRHDNKLRDQVGLGTKQRVPLGPAAKGHQFGVRAVADVPPSR